MEISQVKYPHEMTECFEKAECHCQKCIRANDMYPMFMILCPVCGNKRCPHASDHEYECTNSNESGQEGSVY